MTTEPKKGRKHDQVLEGAHRVFLEHGFEGASVDEIARAAQVSKATLYSYFPTKESMFIAVARAKYQSKTNFATEEMDFCSGPRTCLSFAAITIVNEFLTPFNRSVLRVAVAEAQRFPDLAKEFFEGGPQLVRATLTGYFKFAVERGDLAIEDLTLAADQFTEMCKAKHFMEFMLGVRETFTDAEKQAVADAAVETFLARYGVAENT